MRRHPRPPLEGERHIDVFRAARGKGRGTALTPAPMHPLCHQCPSAYDTYSCSAGYQCNYNTGQCSQVRSIDCGVRFYTLDVHRSMLIARLVCTLLPSGATRPGLRQHHHLPGALLQDTRHVLLQHHNLSVQQVPGPEPAQLPPAVRRLLKLQAAAHSEVQVRPHRPKEPQGAWRVRSGFFFAPLPLLPVSPRLTSLCPPAQCVECDYTAKNCSDFSTACSDCGTPPPTPPPSPSPPSPPSPPPPSPPKPPAKVYKCDIQTFQCVVSTSGMDNATWCVFLKKKKKSWFVIIRLTKTPHLDVQLGPVHKLHAKRPQRLLARHPGPERL